MTINGFTQHDCVIAKELHQPIKSSEKMENSSEGSIDVFDVIGIVLITLKLLAVEPVAHLPWIWVLCPFWIPLAVIVILGILASILTKRR